MKNHHEPIISRADFNRVQEEMARRSSKWAIADKLTKTEQGKYSAKYALSELLICGECGEHEEALGIIGEYVNITSADEPDENIGMDMR